MPRVTHFDLVAKEPARVKTFYEHVFGWKIEKWDGAMDYWMVTTGDDGQPGINGGITRKEDAEKNPMPSNTINVDSLEETIQIIEAHGGEIVMPKMSISGVGWFAVFKDTEGNVMGLMQSDKSSK